MRIGFIGFGKMGSRMVEKLLQDSHEVVVWNRSSAPMQELKFKVSSFAKASADKQNLKVAKTVEDLIHQLEKPRVIWLMLPAGAVTQNMLDEVCKFVEQGDIIIDGGNANFKDTERRYQKLKTENIKYLGIGVSGGVHGFKNGYALMAGGDVSAYKQITPLFNSLAKPYGGHEYFGEGGAGHFVKMVHNGIEYGMMQAIGEGFGVLQKSPYTFDLRKIASLWQKGTIISGFLMDRTFDALTNDAILSSIEGSIEASGEGEWTVVQAKEEGVPIENIEQALEFRKRSKVDSSVAESFAAKLIAALRHEFGGHKVVKKNLMR